MRHSRLQTYCDVLNYQLVGLIVQGQSWPQPLQEVLQSFGNNLQDIMKMVSLMQISPSEICEPLNGLWFALQTLELVQPDPQIEGRLDLMRKILTCISDVVDQNVLHHSDALAGLPFQIDTNTPFFAEVS